MEEEAPRKALMEEERKTMLTEALMEEERRTMSRRRVHPVSLNDHSGLPEVLAVDNFLKKWTDTHKEMLLQNGETMKPVFMHPLLKNNEVLPSHIISRTLTSRKGTESKVFKITSTTDVMMMSFNQETWRKIAMVCVKDLEQKHNIQMGSTFSLHVKDSSSSGGVITVESCSNNGGKSDQSLALKYQISLTTWNDFGSYDVAFCEENKPVHVSCWVASSIPEGHVMAMPYPKDALIVVTPPNSELN
ncbi:hypothetical protein PIB30_071173 [Stylosanthes scabra]|uniref:Uncharacterized protein n=1 Tax=Stylosanthes scabra TaxID=79078 RepID=A0ABU6RNP4_9FABA|nr:hypothetical protein [Stylosanthes scabra]